MPSPREDVALELSDTVFFGWLDDSAKPTINKVVENDGTSFWNVSFKKGNVLQGSVEIRSPKSIVVKWKTAYSDLPASGQKRFGRLGEAKAFLQKFVR